VKVAITKEDSMANGTAFAALEASSAIVADDSKPAKRINKTSEKIITKYLLDTTQTGVRKQNMNAQPLKLSQLCADSP
jgi:hypothetical protein